MYWKSSVTDQHHEVYELLNGDKKLLSLEYHPFTNSARIEYEDTRRVFMLRKEGFLRNKTVLRNEYGIRIGQLGYEKNRGDEGSIELHDKKFSFVLKNDGNSQLVIRDEEGLKPLVTCGLDSDDQHTLQWSKKNPGAEQFLLMALCWYLFLPVARENEVEFAV